MNWMPDVIQAEIKILKLKRKKYRWFSSERKQINKRIKLAIFYGQWIGNCMKIGYQTHDYSVTRQNAIIELHENYKKDRASLIRSYNER